MLQTSTVSPTPLTTDEYETAFRLGSPLLRDLSGISGRVLRGRSDADFGKLSFVEDRRVVFILGAEGLQSIIGKGGAGIILDTGKSPEWLSEELNRGTKWKLAIFSHAKYEYATWSGVFAMLDRYYPEVVHRVLRWFDELRDPSLAKSIAPHLVAPEVRDNASHPLHLTTKRYLAGENSPLNARLFLWHTLSINELFTGTGRIQLPDGTEGPAEYLTANASLGHLSNCRTIALNVESLESKGRPSRGDSSDTSVLESLRFPYCPLFRTRPTSMHTRNVAS